jgi:hypothetical protein
MTDRRCHMAPHGMQSPCAPATAPGCCGDARSTFLPVTSGSESGCADGTSASVYRETVVDRGTTQDPCALVVEFRLRVVRGWGRALFRWESLLNTRLFVGFPGFVSKLWLAHDDYGRYRGVYEWDGPLPG